MRILTVVLAVVWTFLVPPAAFAAGPVGVILMHGKWGSPDYNIVQLADKLNAAGFLVERPLMPWSRKRDYDADYTQAMEEIDAVAERLRKRGATQIAVGGHSFGANVALGYAATRPDVAAILALAPGHVPELFASRLTESIAKARNLVEQGRGEETANFDDINQGKTKIITPKARVYLSYFDPDGPAVMPRNAAAIKKTHALPVGNRHGRFALPTRRKLRIFQGAGPSGKPLFGRRGAARRYARRRRRQNRRMDQAGGWGIAAPTAAHTLSNCEAEMP
ncbi:MAG: alpha/beta fold hydrolase [Rhodospirillales bacterium]|jgi:pimeloyl-ACP methyl ester carboxylesterase